MVNLTQSAFLPLFEGKKPKRKRLLNGFDGAGIYIIREDAVIVYVGMSQSHLTKALYRHFYIWKPDRSRVTRFPRTTYVDDLHAHTYDAAVLVCTSDDAPKLERGLILSIQPRDNRERYQHYLDQISVQNIHQHQQATATDFTDLPF